MTVKQKLDEMRQRCEAATPGPWDNRVGEHLDNHALPRQIWSEYGWIAKCEMGKSHCVPNAAFIASARQDLPALLSALEVYLGAIHEAKLWCDVGAVEKGEDYTLSERLDEALAKAEALLVGEEE